VTKTDDGYVSSGSYETSGGKSGTFTGSGTHDENGIDRTKTVTTGEGKTATRVIDTDFNGDGTGGSRAVTTTGPNGETISHGADVTIDHP